MVRARVAPYFNRQFVVCKTFLEVVECDDSVPQLSADWSTLRRWRSGPPTVGPMNNIAIDEHDLTEDEDGIAWAVQPSAQDSGTSLPWQNDGEHVSQVIWSRMGGNRGEAGVAAMAIEPSNASTGGQRPKRSAGLCKARRERLEKVVRRLVASGTALEDAELSPEMRANAFFMERLKNRLARARQQHHHHGDTSSAAQR